MEFVLTTDLAAAIPQEIGFNYEDLKNQLAESLERYNSLVVTEDAIGPAKKDRAALNKLKTAIEDKRKAVKAACLAPYASFEVKAKELAGMIDEPISAIDRQVKGFEEQKRQDKYAAIENFYIGNIKELRELLPLEKVLPAKWANTGMTLISITQEIYSAIDKARNELGIIQKMNLPFESQIIDVYLKTLDMGAAIAEKSRLEEQERAIEAARKILEEKTAQREFEKPVTLQPSEPIVPEFLLEPTIPTEPSANETLKTIRVIFYDTTPEFRAEMKALTQKHNIKYGGINNVTE